MSGLRRQKPRQERDKTLPSSGALRLRVWLSPSDSAKLRELQAGDEEPLDTIRRLIRTAAMVQPILEALRATRLAPAFAADPQETQQDDLVRRQADAVTAWLPDD